MYFRGSVSPCEGIMLSKPFRGFYSTTVCCHSFEVFERAGIPYVRRAIGAVQLQMLPPFSPLAAWCEHLVPLAWLVFPDICSRVHDLARLDQRI